MPQASGEESCVTLNTLINFKYIDKVLDYNKKVSLNNNEIIDKNYISENTKYAEDLLSVSNDMIVFDLVKKENEKEQASSSK